MAPYLSAVCTLLCLGTSTAFVAPTVSCSSRGITAHRRTCAATAASAGPASRPRRNSLPPLFMADGEVDEEILGKVQEIVAQQLAVEAAQVVPAASFTQDLGADSLDTVELIMALEEGFDIEIEDESAAEIMTVKDAVDFISKATK